MSSPPALGHGDEAEEEDRKPVIPEAAEGDYINIKVTSQTSADVFFRIKRDARLRRLMDLYCGKHSLNPATVVFLDQYGKAIRPAQTPEEVGLKDGDSIDINPTQHGGFGRTSV